MNVWNVLWGLYVWEHNSASPSSALKKVCLCCVLSVPHTHTTLHKPKALRRSRIKPYILPHELFAACQHAVQGLKLLCVSDMEYLLLLHFVFHAFINNLVPNCHCVCCYICPHPPRCTLNNMIVRRETHGQQQEQRRISATGIDVWVDVYVCGCYMGGVLVRYVWVSGRRCKI